MAQFRQQMETVCVSTLTLHLHPCMIAGISSKLWGSFLARGGGAGLESEGFEQHIQEVQDSPSAFPKVGSLLPPHSVTNEMPGGINPLVSVRRMCLCECVRVKTARVRGGAFLCGCRERPHDNWPLQQHSGPFRASAGLGSNPIR